MVEMKQELTQKQIDSFLKHDGMMSTNVYDKFYKKVREKVKELQKKRKRGEDTGLRYSGSYTAGKRTFYIVELDNMKVHMPTAVGRSHASAMLKGRTTCTMNARR